jgi:hypothetical protein
MLVVWVVVAAGTCAFSFLMTSKIESRSMHPRSVVSFFPSLPYFLSPSFLSMEIVQRSLRSYIFRYRMTGKACPCGIQIPWSKLRANKSIPKCGLHASPIELWSQSPLHNGLAVSAFRTELLARRAYYGTRIPEVLNLAFSQGQAHVLAVFRIFANFWNQPHKFYSRLATSMYYRCMRLGWSATMKFLRGWKTVHLPHQSYATPLLRELRSLASPVIREELRDPVYAKILRVFAAEQFLNLPGLKSSDVRLCKIYREGFATTITRYQWRLLGFWMTVRTKIAHWRTAHTFKPLPSFTPNTESLPLLVQRNPRRVPNAAREFSRALNASNTPLSPNDLQDWISSLTVESEYPLLHDVTELYGRNQAWRELAEFFTSLSVTRKNITPHLLTYILYTFELAPIAYYQDIERPLRHYLTAVDFAPGPTAACGMLHAFHPLCREPADFQFVFYAPNVSRYIEHPDVATTIVHLYMNRSMCLRLASLQSRSPIAQAFWETPAVQQKYAKIRANAEDVLRRFLRNTSMSYVLKAAVAYTHAWNTLRIRWRYLHRSVRGDCPICMETRLLEPLHGERRHGVCKECRPRVECTGRCPICRADLPYCSAGTNSVYSSVSYTSDHEDMEYDDDAWYQYN